MMKLRRDNDVSQPAKLDLNVCMVKDSLNSRFLSRLWELSTYLSQYISTKAWVYFTQNFRSKL